MAVKISAACDIVDCEVTDEQVLVEGHYWELPPGWKKFEGVKPGTDRYWQNDQQVLICPEHAKLFRQPPESKEISHARAELKVYEENNARYSEELRKP